MPKLSRRTCTCENGLQPCRGKPAGVVARRPRERNVTIRNFAVGPRRERTVAASVKPSRRRGSSGVGTEREEGRAEGREAEGLGVGAGLQYNPMGVSVRASSGSTGFQWGSIG